MAHEDIIQPDINLFGLRIQEPMTSATDLLIAAVCIYAWWRLKKAKLVGVEVTFMKYYFLAMAAATISGGIFGHAFQYVFSFAWKVPGWYISMVSIMLVERASIEHARKYIKPMVGKFFLWLNVLELIVLMMIATITLEFRWVEYHAVYGLLIVVFSFHLFTYIRSRNRGSRNMLVAIGTLVVAMIAFNLPIVPNVWFNHRDLAHILMAISVVWMMRATLFFNHVPEPRS